MELRFLKEADCHKCTNLDASVELQYDKYGLYHGTIIRTGITCKKIPL